MVGHVLDLGQLVVVRKNHRIALVRQLPHFFSPVDAKGTFGAYSINGDGVLFGCHNGFFPYTFRRAGSPDFAVFAPRAITPAKCTTRTFEKEKSIPRSAR